MSDLPQEEVHIEALGKKQEGNVQVETEKKSPQEGYIEALEIQPDEKFPLFLAFMKSDRSNWSGFILGFPLNIHDAIWQKTHGAFEVLTSDSRHKLEDADDILILRGL